MITTKIQHIAHLVEICAAKGVKNVVVSPGSRNAPLVTAFDNHPQIKVFVIHDERSAAFFAIGMADALNEPVAITCTSGSATLNYAPAVAEAYYRKVPLLVLTADRPVHLIDQGDGQTIRQKNVFANYCKQSFELPENELETSDKIADEALSLLVSEPYGPIHINLPLSEPLYETAELKERPQVQKSQKIEQQLSPKEKENISALWKKYDKKLVIIGQLVPNPALEQSLIKLSEDPSVAFLVENTSNLQHFAKLCHCIDRVLVSIKENEIEKFKPDLLVYMGGAIISKKIKAFFRENTPIENWKVGIDPFVQDTFQSLTQSFKVSELTFCEYLNSLEYLPDSNFGNVWKQRDFINKDKHNAFLESCEFSDLHAFDLILDTLPDDINLQMGNSSVVRYCQLFDPIRGVRYFSNRGVSGIDGSTSTALGMAIGDPKRLTVLISGDTSFFYDSNAFWNNYLPNNFRVIVVNNGGGGIFKIIPGPQESEQKDLFFAPHQGSVEGLCKAFNVNHYRVSNEADLVSVFGEFYSYQENDRPAVLEIDTSNIPSHDVLKEYFEKISS